MYITINACLGGRRIVDCCLPETNVLSIAMYRVVHVADRRGLMFAFRCPPDFGNVITCSYSHSVGRCSLQLCYGIPFVVVYCWLRWHQSGSDAVLGPMGNAIGNGLRSLTSQWTHFAWCSFLMRCRWAFCEAWCVLR